MEEDHHISIHSNIFSDSFIIQTDEGRKEIFSSLWKENGRQGDIQMLKKLHENFGKLPKEMFSRKLCDFMMDAFLAALPLLPKNDTYCVTLLELMDMDDFRNIRRRYTLLQTCVQSKASSQFFDVLFRKGMHPTSSWDDFVIRSSAFHLIPVICRNIKEKEDRVRFLQSTTNRLLRDSNVRDLKVLAEILKYLHDERVVWRCPNGYTFLSTALLAAGKDHMAQYLIDIGAPMDRYLCEQTFFSLSYGIFPARFLLKNGMDPNYVTDKDLHRLFPDDVSYCNITGRLLKLLLENGNKMISKDQLIVAVLSQRWICTPYPPVDQPHLCWANVKCWEDIESQLKYDWITFYPSWNIQRLLWIAWKKQDGPMAVLPKEIIYSIIREYLTPPKQFRYQTQTTRGEKRKRDY